MEALEFFFNTVLINPMMNGLILLSDILFGSYGLAIVAFTVIARLLTYPLVLRQLRTTRAMQEMQPHLQEIQKKYKDPRRRQQEMMKVYREVGFNPLGCVMPLLIQMPIWIALFQVIRQSLGTTPESLFGLSGRLYDWNIVTEAPPLDRAFLTLDLANPSLVLAILVAVGTFVQQKLSTTRSVAKDDRQAGVNRTMIWLLPLMFGFFSMQVPSGLALYWFVTTLFTIMAAFIYNGPENFRWRQLFSMEPMLAPSAALASVGAGAGDANASPEAAREQREEQSEAAPSPRRRRRRRRRRRGGNRPQDQGRGAAGDAAQPPMDSGNESPNHQSDADEPQN